MREDPVTKWLIKQTVKDDQTPVRRNAAIGLLEGYTSIAINTVLFVIKLAIGFMVGSIALIADAVHTMGDTVTSVVIIVSAYVARKPPDRKHPFGHERAEAVAAIIVAVLLGVAALELGKAAVERIRDPLAMFVPWWTIGVITITMLIKQWLSNFALILSRRASSGALKADAWHHLSDVFATGLVVLGMIGSRYGVLWLDGIMGILVAVIIISAAYVIAKDALSPLLGEAPSEEELSEIGFRARDVTGVLGVHDIVVHRYGHTRVISLHVETSHRLSARDLHAIAEKVEETVGQDGHGMVVVHVDPVDRDHPDYPLLQQMTQRLVDANPHLTSFHDLRIMGEGDGLLVEVDLSTRDTLSDAQRHEIIRAFEEVVRTHSRPVTLKVHFDPVFAYGIATTGGDEPGR